MAKNFLREAEDLFFRLRGGAVSAGKNFLERGSNARQKLQQQEGLAASVGRYLQNLPQPQPMPVAAKYYERAGLPVYDPIQKMSESVTDYARSLGRTLENVASPQGRQNLVSSAIRTATTRPSLQTFQEPAVEAAFNLSPFTAGRGSTFRSFLPQMGSGVQTLQEARAAIIPTLRSLRGVHPEDITALDQAVDILRFRKKQPSVRIKNAIDYVDKLADRYLTREQIDKVGGNTKRMAQILQKQFGQDTGLFRNQPLPGLGIVQKGKEPTLDQVTRGAMARIKNLQLQKTQAEFKTKFPTGSIVNQAKQKIKQSSNLIKNKPIRQHFDEFYTNWVNRFQPIENLTKRAEAATKSVILPTKSPRYAITRLLGAGGKAELRNKQKLQPIIAQLGDIPPDDFDVFLKAKRDIELSERGIQGSNAEEAQQIIDELSQHYDPQVLNNVAEQLYSYQSQGLQALKDAGFLDNVVFSRIQQANTKYVPFQRVMDEIDDFLGIRPVPAQQGSQPVQKIKGSERAILSPLESIIANTYKIEAAIAKNRVAQSVANLGKLFPGSGIQKVKKSGTGTISVWENGSKAYYQVPDDVARSIKGLNEEPMDTIVKIMSAPARLLRQQATGRNLEFMIPNVFRDQFDAAINSQYGYRPFLDYFEGLRHLINFERKGSDDIMESFFNSGGGIFFQELSGRKEISSKALKVDMKKSIARRINEAVIGGIDVIGKYSEMPTRIGLFKNALKKTNNPLIAAREAREATLDFARMGAKMKKANALVPFLNVGIQGFDRIIRTARHNPGKAGLAMALYGGVPATVTAIYNNFFKGEEWAKIPDFEKQGNFIFITDQKDSEGNAVYIKVPKSHIQELIANPIEQLITYAAGNNPQAFGQFAMNFLADGLPILEGGNTPGEVASRTIGSNLPQAFKPAVQAIANYDFFRNRQIVPWWMEEKPPAEQYFDSTEGIYRYIGNVLQVSPLMVKNVMETTLAGGVKQPINVHKTLEGLSGQKPLSPNDLFVGRRFVGSHADFDIERPEGEVEGAGFLSRLLQPQAGAEAAESTSEFPIPTEPEKIKIIYKDALSKTKDYQEDITKNEYSDKEESKKKEAFQKRRDEFVRYANMKKEIENKYPEIVFETEIDVYKSSGGRTVEERAGWAYKKLSEVQSEEEFNQLYEKMLDGDVLTKNVLEHINDTYDLSLTDYVSSGKRKSLGGSGKKRKITIGTVKKASLPSRRLKVKSMAVATIKGRTTAKITIPRNNFPTRRESIPVKRAKLPTISSQLPAITRVTLPQGGGRSAVRIGGRSRYRS